MTVDRENRKLPSYIKIWRFFKVFPRFHFNQKRKS
jgi:hypothetical protein